MQDQSIPVATTNCRLSKCKTRFPARVGFRPVNCDSAAASSATAGTTAAPIRGKPFGHEAAVSDDTDTESPDSSASSNSSAAEIPIDDRRDSRMFSAFYPSASTSVKHSTPQTGLVFLHGVGLGILPYMAFIWKLLNVFEKDTPIIVPQVRPQLVLKNVQYRAYCNH
jgi:hypothetical protein